MGKKSLLSEEFQIRKRLQEQELANAKERSVAIERNKEIANARRNAEIYEKQQRYASSRTGKFTSSIRKGLNFIRNPTRTMYARGIPMGYTNTSVYGKQTLRQTFRGTGTGRRGRPAGTVKYRDERGNPIGVYEYRALMRARIRQQREQYLNKISTTPEQRRIYAQIQARKQYEQSNPEGKIIPSTNGFIYLNDIMGDIEQATHAFD